MADHQRHKLLELGGIVVRKQGSGVRDQEAHDRQVDNFE
jgi:hypothetical protein